MKADAAPDPVFPFFLENGKRGLAAALRGGRCEKASI